MKRKDLVITEDMVMQSLKNAGIKFTRRNDHEGLKIIDGNNVMTFNELKKNSRKMYKVKLKIEGGDIIMDLTGKEYTVLCNISKRINEQKIGLFDPQIEIEETKGYRIYE